MIANNLRETLEFMKDDLAQNTLEVELIPASESSHDSHCVRVVRSRNPEWYRDLCEMFPRNRRKRAGKYTDSIVNRRDVLKVIDDLIKGASTSQYAQPLLEFADELQNL